MKGNSHARLRNIALRRFKDSGSFNEAKVLADKLILPIAKELSVQQIIQFLEIVTENGQIMFAWGIPDIVKNVFDESYNKLDKTVDNWKNFVTHHIKEFRNVKYNTDIYCRIETLLNNWENRK